MIPLDAARDCRVYEFEVLDPWTGYRTKTVGYVGETARMPFERLMEHVNEQPWADTITSWRVLDEVYPDKSAVLVAEDATIKTRLPLYNIKGNMDNPRRVPPWDAQRQRAERDAAKGLASDGHLAGIGRPAARRPAAPTPNARPSRLSPVWRRRRDVVLTRSCVWLGLSLLASWVVARYTPLTAGQTAAPAGLVVAALMTWTAPHWRQRRGLRRRTCDAFAAVLVIAGLALLGYSVDLPHAGHVPAALIPTVPARK